jgi:hypothetical protein
MKIEGLAHRAALVAASRLLTDNIARRTVDAIGRVLGTLAVVTILGCHQVGDLEGDTETEDGSDPISLQVPGSDTETEGDSETDTDTVCHRYTVSFCECYASRECRRWACITQREEYIPICGF